MKNRGLIWNALIIIVVLAAVFFGYRLFFGAESAAPGGLVGLAPANLSGGGQAAATDEFLALLLNLQAIDLSEVDEVVASLEALEDFSTELKPQTPGRENPFAPIGVGGAPDAPAAASSTPAGADIGIGVSGS